MVAMFSPATGCHDDSPVVDRLDAGASDPAAPVLLANVRLDPAAEVEVERRVNVRVAELVAANRALESFAGAVAHELRGPLRTIDSSCALLAEEEGAAGGSAVERIARMRGASKRMNAMISDLLDLSRASGGELHVMPVDLSAMAREIAAELALAPEGHAVEWRIAPGLTARGDAALLRMALENLLGNAWKFTRHSPRPWIELGRVGGGDSALPEFHVRDNGVGFDAGQAERLFTPFQRLHDARDYEGNGIGLASVRRIIQRHGGSVRAEGVPGKGATFVFSVPDWRAAYAAASIGRGAAGAAHWDWLARFRAGQPGVAPVRAPPVRADGALWASMPPPRRRRMEHEVSPLSGLPLAWFAAGMVLIVLASLAF
jgi:signal transduction histidine kinase